jgi:DNA-binding NarL/FixJ family response regulator
MSNKPEHILIVHPSPIVFLGLAKAIRIAGIEGEVEYANSFDLMKGKLASDPFSLVFVSPLLMMNLNDQLKEVQKEHNFKLIALVSEFQPGDLGQCFDYHLNMNGPFDEIVASIGKKMSDARETLNQGTSLLSDREIEVLRLLTQGLSNKEIADKLFISFHTVVSHRKNIVQKTGIKSVSGLTIYAVSNRLIEMPTA